MKEIEKYENIPIDFNEEIYLDLNPDVKIANTDAKLHYEIHGYYENRKYKYENIPIDFNKEIYLDLNPDVKIANTDAKLHYEIHGYYENRKYKYENIPIDFNEEICIEENEEIDIYANEEICIDANEEICIDANEEICIEANDKKSKLNFSQINFVNLENNYTTISNLDMLNSDSFILVVDFPKYGGGTNVFMNIMLNKYKYNQTFLIARNIYGLVQFTINDEYVLNTCFNENESIEFIIKNKDKIIKIFFNHTLGHSINFLNSLFKINKEVTTITHDYILLCENPQAYNDIPQAFYDYLINIKNIPDNKVNINNFNNIIFQNISNYNIFKKFLNNNNINKIISEIPDFKEKLNLIKTNNTTIIVGVIGEVSNIKGKKYIENINNYLIENNINIKIIVFGHINYIDSINDSNNDTNNNILECYRYYNINELNDLLVKFKPNLILETSIWPETYSYTLSLSMITSLPILSIIKNFQGTISNRLSKYLKKYFFQDVNEFIELANKYKQDYFYTIKPNIYFNSFWDNYFITSKQKIKFDNISFKYDIKPYIIYFPQFHNIPENNVIFYPDFKDTKNLDLLNKSNLNNNIESPNLSELNIKTIDEYNLENKILIQKQIDILYDYNISGIAIYYYWFSSNSITNQNMIMDKVINNFFDSSINLKNLNVFFIWANEDWSNNAAFGNSNEKIENVYNLENILNNVNNLMKYFTHKNYLKIDNKPVFFIYHPWFINDNELNIIFNVLNTECLKNNFSGIHMVINNMYSDYNDYLQFYINFNYKKEINEYIYMKNNKKVIDYKKYINDKSNYKSNCIQTIVYDFDNTARLFKPDKVKFSRKCINNTEFDKIIFTNKIIENYNMLKKSEIENILLINAFNEWGEKMVFEPSEEYGYYNLNLLSSCLNNK